MISAPSNSLRVDRENGVIRGVSVMSIGEAKGHGLTVDETTLRQIDAEGKRIGRVPVKCDHGAGVMHVCGHLTNFRMQGKQLLADWKLLKKFPGYEQILETAQEQPETVGLSASFVDGDHQQLSQSGPMAARCSELLSVDYVIHPAANPGGLFSARVNGQLINFSRRDKPPVGRVRNSYSGRRAVLFDHRNGMRLMCASGQGAGDSPCPHHFSFIDEAIELVRVPGPIRRPDRARAATAEASTSTTRQGRNVDGQFKSEPASSPDKMRLAYQKYRARRNNRAIPAQD